MHEVGGGQLPAGAHILPGGTLPSLEAGDIGLHLQPVLELGVLAVEPEGALDLPDGLNTRGVGGNALKRLVSSSKRFLTMVATSP